MGPKLGHDLDFFVMPLSSVTIPWVDEEDVAEEFDIAEERGQKGPQLADGAPEDDGMELLRPEIAYKGAI